MSARCLRRSPPTCSARTISPTCATIRIDGMKREGDVAEIKIFSPDVLGKPLGQYSQITRVKASEFIYIAGQLATNRDGQIIGADDFDAQCDQVFANYD